MVDTHSLPWAKQLVLTVSQGMGWRSSWCPSTPPVPTAPGDKLWASPLQGLMSDFLPAQPASRKPRPGERVSGTLGPHLPSHWALDTAHGLLRGLASLNGLNRQAPRLWSINNAAPSLASLMWPITFPGHPSFC